jgi:hypothetical protein
VFDTPLVALKALLRGRPPLPSKQRMPKECGFVDYDAGMRGEFRAICGWN